MCRHHGGLRPRSVSHQAGSSSADGFKVGLSETSGQASGAGLRTAERPRRCRGAFGTRGPVPFHPPRMASQACSDPPGQNDLASREPRRHYPARSRGGSRTGEQGSFRRSTRRLIGMARPRGPLPEENTTHRPHTTARPPRHASPLRPNSGCQRHLRIEVRPFRRYPVGGDVCPRRCHTHHS